MKSLAISAFLVGAPCALCTSATLNHSSYQTLPIGRYSQQNCKMMKRCEKQWYTVKKKYEKNNDKPSITLLIKRCQSEDIHNTPSRHMAAKLNELESESDIFCHQ